MAQNKPPISDYVDALKSFFVIRWREDNSDFLYISLLRDIPFGGGRGIPKGGYHVHAKNLCMYGMVLTEPVPSPEELKNQTAIKGEFRAIKYNDVNITLYHVVEAILTFYPDEIEPGAREYWREAIIEAKKPYTPEELEAMNAPDPNQTTLFPPDAEEFSPLDRLISIVPQNAVKPINKLANEITRDFINEGEIALRVSKAGAKREITTKAMLTYEDENISLSGRAKFTPYDREVHDGVVTLYVAGNEVVTPTMVYRAMNGMTETERISHQAVGAVTRSLDKSRKTTLKIDFSQEAQAYKKDCKATYEGHLLACDKITVSSGGKAQAAFKLLRKPILYEYSQVSGQIITIPIKYLQTKGAVRSTEDVIVIRGYLLRQIMGMKSPSFKRNNKITYDGIYAELDMMTLSEKARADKALKVRKHVEAILSDWIEQGLIKSFDTYKEGKTLKGIAITF